MEEPVLMSDEETSDSEVIFVDNSPPPSTEMRGKKEPPKIVTEEMRIDEQLKDLGLFEEGMSMEQKQELLVVLAASRETAEQEESMRQKAIEWERRLFSDVDDISSYDEPNEDDNHWKSNCSKTTPVSYGRNSLPVADSSRGIKCLPVSKAEESYSQKMKFTEEAFKMLDVEENSKTSDSQDSKSVSTTAITTDLFYSHANDVSLPIISSDSQRRTNEGSQREKRHLSRSAYCPPSPSGSKVAVAHPMIRDSGSEMVLRDEDSSSHSPVDYHGIKFKLEKCMAYWKPCTSPVACDLDCKRSSQKDSVDYEYVPLFCPENYSPKEYTNIILNCFKKFHLNLRKMQARSRMYSPWGESIKVGRHHLDSLDALTPRHQVKVRNSDRMATRLSNRSNVEVSYAETESKECNEDSAVMSVDKFPEQSSSDSNNVVRTSKSAFRPIKTPLHLTDKENDAASVSGYDLHGNECSKLDSTIPRSKSCPSPGASNSNVASDLEEHHRRTYFTNLSGNKQLPQEPGVKENFSGLRQWSPFASSSAMLINNEVTNFNAFSNAFAGNKTTASFDGVHSEIGTDISKEKTGGTEIENNCFDPQFHVRKDGQKTYSSRSHYTSEKSSATGIVETCENKDISGRSNDENVSECNLPTEDSSLLKGDDNFLCQIEEGGITRKRKCELRLKRLTPNELKAASPRKRWKKQS